MPNNILFFPGIKISPLLITNMISINTPANNKKGIWINNWKGFTIEYFRGENKNSFASSYVILNQSGSQLLLFISI